MRTAFCCALVLTLGFPASAWSTEPVPAVDGVEHADARSDGTTTRPASRPDHPETRVSASAGGKLVDRLELERTQITGNSELPKVMVIVPWKRADIGDLAGQPLNSLIGEALQPVDRETFRREIGYFHDLGRTDAVVEPGHASPTGGKPEN